MAAPTIPLNLRECPYCGNGVWAIREARALLKHKSDCFFQGETLIYTGSSSAKRWNTRVDCKILPQVSPVSENPGEQEFYDKAEASIIQGSER